MHETIERLFSFPGRNLTTFHAFQKLDQKLKFPHRSFRSIHVGGTNGKGSVALKIATALQIAGFRVGLYTSPHLVDFRERIRVNGEMISLLDAIRILDTLFPLIEGDLSFFDLLTALGFLYFQEKEVDWAVIEVGIGGRLDATNVIHPEIATITSIGFDHMELLGPSLDAIAREKRGIVKPLVPLIVGPSAQPFFPDATAASRHPFYDLENSEVARLVLEKLGISKEAIAEGLKVRPPYRFERVGNLILDVAHNRQGFQKLAQALRFHFPEEKFHFYVGFTKNKDWEGCLDEIEPLAIDMTALRGSSDKLIAPEEIAMRRKGVKIGESIVESKEKSILSGSFYIMEFGQSTAARGILLD